MSKSIRKNYIYNLSYQIVAFLIPLVSTPYLSRVLGADGVGTVSYIESIVSYFVLAASLGTATYGQRQIAYVRDSQIQRSCFFWETQIFRTCMTVLVIVPYLLFVFLTVQGESKWLYVIFGMHVLTVAVDIVWFFQGMEEFGKIAFRSTAVKIISLVLFFVLVKSKTDLGVYVLIYVGINFLASIMIWGFLPQYVISIPIRELHPFKHVHAIFLLFLPTIAIQIYTVLDKTMLGVITRDSFQNGYYEQATKIAKIPLTVISALGTVMISRISYHHKRGEKKTVQECLMKSYQFAWFLSIPMCIGIIMIASNMVPWFLGDGYDSVVLLLQIQALLIPIIAISMVTGNQYLIATQREGIYTKTVLIGAATNLVFNLILISRYKALGASISSVVAEFVIVIVQIVILRQELPMKNIIRTGKNYLISGIIMFVPLLFMKSFLSSSIVNTTIMICGGVFTYVVGLLLLKDTFFLSNMQSVIKFLLKGKDSKK